MTQTFNPRDYQQAMLEHLAKVRPRPGRRVNLWGGMGVGKTVVVLTYLDWDYNMLGGDPRPTLVIGPLRVVQSVWPDEQHKWSHLKNLRVVSVTGTAEQRRAALEPGAHVYCINYDNILWLTDELATQGRPWPFRRVVPDESTRLKNFRIAQGGRRAAALGAVAHKHVEEWINLTGTPAPNGLKDLWGQAWFLDEGTRLGLSFSAFERRWFAFQKTKDHEHGISIVLPFAQQQIEDALKDITLTVRAGDFMDLPALVENVIHVDLPPKAMTQYKELQREMYLALNETHEVEAFNAASLTMKCLQMANGAVYQEDGKTFTEVHDVKLQALASVVEEAAGAPVLVAYHFKSDLARLQKAFPVGRALDADPRTIRDWNEGRIPILFAHPASAGHGLNLQDGGNIIVFFGLWWDLEQHEQIIERIGPTRQKQSGYDRPVYVHRIVARKTVDEVVLARLSTKASVQSALLDAMKPTKETP